MKYGYRKDDGLLNEHGVCTSKNKIERIDLLEGCKGCKRSDHAIVEIVTTPNGKFLIGISFSNGNSGFGFAPSINSKAFDNRMEAIRYAFDRIMNFTPMDSKVKSAMEDNYYRIKDDEEQLTLF